MEKNGIIYTHLTNEHLDETVDLIADIFLHREPTTSVLGINPVLYKSCTKFFLNMSIKTGFCIIAKDISSKKVIGFQTARDFAPATPFDFTPEILEFFEAHAASMALEEKQKEEYLSKRNFKPGGCIHFMQLGVMQGFERKGIGTSLVEYALDYFVGKGYKTFLSDCSSLTSKHCLERCGFREENNTDYKTFEYEGKHWFKDLEGGCSFMVKEY